MPPDAGLLWTPGWWGWSGDAYTWNAGYWGPTVGFYGGINYGFGYYGNGFSGGRWDHGNFAYNTAVWRVDSNAVRGHVYQQSVAMNNGSHVSFNGGNGGVNAHANAEEMAAAHGRHVGPTAAQTSQRTAASRDRGQFASANGGHPPIAAMGKVGDRSHVVAAHDAPAHPNVAAVHTMNAKAHSADEAARANNMANANRAANAARDVLPQGRVAANNAAANRAAPNAMTANHGAANANHAAPNAVNHAAPAANRGAAMTHAPAQATHNGPAMARPAPTPRATPQPHGNTHPMSERPPVPGPGHPAAAPRPTPMAAPRPAPMAAPRPMAARHPEPGGGEQPHR